MSLSTAVNVSTRIVSRSALNLLVDKKGTVLKPAPAADDPCLVATLFPGILTAPSHVTEGPKPECLLA